MAQLNSIKPKSKRGGKRPGAGRKAGSRNVASLAEIKSIAAAAKLLAPVALHSLGKISDAGESESARVTASIHILDRAFGKTTEHVELSGPNGAAIAVEEQVTIEDRSRYDFARRVALLLGKGKAQLKLAKPAAE